jgi:hypothetical protein
VTPLFLLDRDGVVVVNRAGFHVTICTNQPEVARGVLSRVQLDHVHEGFGQMLAARGAKVELVLCCARRPKVPLVETFRWHAARGSGALRRTCGTHTVRRRSGRRPQGGIPRGAASACWCAPALAARHSRKAFRSMSSQSPCSTISQVPWTPSCGASCRRGSLRRAFDAQSLSSAPRGRGPVRGADGSGVWPSASIPWQQTIRRLAPCSARSPSPARKGASAPINCDVRLPGAAVRGTLTVPCQMEP